MSSLFVSKSDSPKTPTLRQWYKNNEGKVPAKCSIKTIFSPGKYAGYTFLTEHGFKVTLSKESQFNDVFDIRLNELMGNDTALFVAIIDGNKGEWELEASDTERASWEEFEWGFKLAITNPRSSKSARSSKSKASSSEAS